MLGFLALSNPVANLTGETKMNDSKAVNAAFELVRKYGFAEAKRKADASRDMNSIGTYSFAEHNMVCKWVDKFVESGACFRTIA